MKRTAKRIAIVPAMISPEYLVYLTLLNRRMKKRGMLWCRPNATAVVALRTDLLNDDWILPQRLRAFP